MKCLECDDKKEVMVEVVVAGQLISDLKPCICTIDI